MTGDIIRLDPLLAQHPALVVDGLFGIGISRPLSAEWAQFIERVVEYARRFTLPTKAIVAVGKLKRAIQASLEIPIEQALAFELEMQAQLLRTQDVAEGLQAWVEKRDPNFQGR